LPLLLVFNAVTVKHKTRVKQGLSCPKGQLSPPSPSTMKANRIKFKGEIAGLKEAETIAFRQPDSF